MTCYASVNHWLRLCEYPLKAVLDAVNADGGSREFNLLNTRNIAQDGSRYGVEQKQAALDYDFDSPETSANFAQEANCEFSPHVTCFLPACYSGG